MINIVTQYETIGSIPEISIEASENISDAETMTALLHFYTMIANRPELVSNFIKIVSECYGDTCVVDVINKCNNITSLKRNNPEQLAKTIAGTPLVPVVFIPQSKIYT